MAVLRSPITIGLLTFVVLFVALGWLLPTVCVDGWRSPSIGIQGACSSHGGVAESRDLIRLGIALLAAVGLAVSWWFFRRLAPQPADPRPASNPAVIPNCEACGAPMRLVTSDGVDRYMWVCTREGTDHPTRSMSGSATA